MGLLLTRVDPRITVSAGVAWLGVVALMAMFIVAGAVFDEVAAMVVTMPFVLPLITSWGFDPVWWGVINVVIKPSHRQATVNSSAALATAGGAFMTDGELNLLHRDPN